MTTSIVTLRFSTQMRIDMARINRELSSLQAQIASGAKANDLLGFGSSSNRLVSARGLMQVSDSRASAANQLTARFAVQSAALSRAAQGVTDLAVAIRSAVSADDGRTLDVDLGLAFSAVVSAMNETWNGQPLFAGERTTGAPVIVSTLQGLASATGPTDIYDEAERHQLLDLGVGEPIAVADKASEIVQPIFNAMTAMYNLVQAAGGRLGEDIPAEDKASLQQIAADLEAGVGRLTGAEARSGQLEGRLETEHTRMKARSTLLNKEIGQQIEADIPLISVQLATLQAQYQATAKVFSDLSKMTLLDYL